MKLQIPANCNSEEALRLTPEIAPFVRSVLEDKQFLFDLVDGFGSPLSLLFPETLQSNIAQFQRAFEQNSVSGKVFFAHKCNQSESLIRQLAFEECNIDVSSTRELAHALQSGFVGSRIEATGPKTEEFLALAIQHGVSINVDSIFELKHIITLSCRLKNYPPIEILLRLSGFKSEHSRILNKDSRFGIPISQVDEALSILEENTQISLIGFAFHLNTVDVFEKMVAIENCLNVFETAINRGFNPTVLNIGGGYKVNYLAYNDDWDRYTSALKEAALGARKPLTWQGASFGLRGENGVLRGNLNSYSFYDKQTGGDYLDELLKQELPNLGNVTVASFLRDNMIQLWIEPGRALVDQCGVTLARVNGSSVSSENETLINLLMKRQDISFLDQEIFMDPVVVSRTGSTKQAGGFVYFTGNLCLESDLIYRHKTYLDAIPVEGDLIAFANTAGYFMDFNATQSIMQPVARRVAVTGDGTRLRWFLDDCYYPFKKETPDVN